MADQSIRKEFVEGVQEIFTTLFNDGSEETDGVFFYALSDQTKTNVYGETKFKTYKAPVLLVCKAVLNPTHGEQSVEEVKDTATFCVTYQSLMDNDLSVTAEGLSALRRGMVKFHDKFYLVDLINPRAYVEDVFLFYDFHCTEDPEITSDTFEIEEPEEDNPEEEEPDTPEEPEDPEEEPEPDVTEEEP